MAARRERLSSRNLVEETSLPSISSSFDNRTGHFRQRRVILVKRLPPPGENDSEVSDFLRERNETRFNAAQLVLGKLSYLEDVKAFIRHIGLTDEARQDPAFVLRSREAMQAI